MRTTMTSLAVLTAFAMMACMDERRQEPTTQPEASVTAGMDEPVDSEVIDSEVIEERARIVREQAHEPPPQYGELDTEPMEPPTYGEMQREPGELDPQYGLTQPPMGADIPPSYDEMPIGGETGDMASRIEETLRTIPGLEDDDIEVRIEGSRVHLSGLVDSPVEVMQARDVVGGLPGISEVVVDELRVVTTR